jgi:alpha-D-ribose 1-methylphosphonate 5-triphosphate diphosphatase
MSDELVLRNAKIVLADEIIDGSVVVRDGAIADICSGAAASGEDLDGDYLLPGFVELHTDALEAQYRPRVRVRWSPDAAIQQHDAQVAASGITTVFDALRVGLDYETTLDHEDAQKLAGAIERATTGRRLRAEHYIHVRCEVSTADCLEGFQMLQGHPQVKLASLMDHAPGQRQFPSFEAAKTYYTSKHKMSDAEFDAFQQRRNAESRAYGPGHRNAIAQYCRDHGIALASHDDATVEHVNEAVAQGIDVAEFPTTEEAARASHEAGMAVLMGAPNVVRGASHTGNVSAQSLVDAGLLDILSSDYIPFSLMQAVFKLSSGDDAIELPRAVRMVSKHPAEATGLIDRGEIAIGKRADLARVQVADGLPVVRAVWREGGRVI